MQDAHAKVAHKKSESDDGSGKTLVKTSVHTHA